MDTNIHDSAAFEAQMAAAETLHKALGRKASPIEVACVLATTYGVAVGIAGAATSNQDLVIKINKLAQEAYEETLKATTGLVCEDAP